MSPTAGLAVTQRWLAVGYQHFRDCLPVSSRLSIIGVAATGRIAVTFDTADFYEKLSGKYKFG